MSTPLIHYSYLVIEAARPSYPKIYSTIDVSYGGQQGKIYGIPGFRSGRRRVGVGRGARSTVHAEEGGAYESVANESVGLIGRDEMGWV
ncbi:hypothetical protein K443DRAFT_687292 [Laccaria amethystina LaAM-08-1]|uniref:Uncharacterized protein n=1 Tax=Laccaria amethystina LaAM-08-1 TaxID=1095629 RepID=A0A0C9WKF3_9AGAR|nr:hypothetical protein K443DRAFT_687292 [Laccaria amethystina LaAM-08-1]